MQIIFLGALNCSSLYVGILLLLLLISAAAAAAVTTTIWTTL